MFALDFFSNQTFIPQFLPQLNKRSCSIFSPTKQTLPSASSPTKQALALNLFSNQTNVRPRFLFLLSKIRGQGQEGVGNLGGASDWASRGEALCVIRGAPWVSDPRPGRAAGRVGPPSAQDITNYKLAKNPIPPKAATNLPPSGRCTPQRTLPNGSCRCPRRAAVRAGPPAGKPPAPHSAKGGN